MNKSGSDKRPVVDFPGFAACKDLDSEFFDSFAALERASRVRAALDERTRALISLALSASIGLMDQPGVRYFIRLARDAGASTGEIVDTIHLASVLGVHGYMRGVEALIEVVELSDVKVRGGTELAERQKQARKTFESRRGYWVDAWEINSWLGPEFVEAYAEYSSRPHEDAHLARKVRELIYTAIDFFPTMEAGQGGKGHIVQALSNGATVDEIMETLEIVALFGFRSTASTLPFVFEEANCTVRT